MLSRIISSAVRGVDSYLVDVETNITNGLPHFSTVGLPDIAVRESKDRVEAAIKQSGFVYPYKRVTINLAPANVRKAGSLFDTKRYSHKISRISGTQSPGISQQAAFKSHIYHQ